MRWISYILVGGGLAVVSAGLYLGSTGAGAGQSTENAKTEAPAATATTIIAPPASALEATPTATPEPVIEPEPELALAAVEVQEEQPSAPLPQTQPAQAPIAPTRAAATATPRPPAPAPTQAPPPPPTSTPVPPPPPPPAAPVASLAGLEGSMFAAHNAERAGHGLAAFTLDGALTQIARQRAQDMASKGYFSHTSPSGQTAFTLLTSSGYSYSLAGENLARNNYPDGQSVSVAMSGFMQSASHRVNVLEVKFTRIGIGMAMGADGLRYYAVVFAAR